MTQQRRQDAIRLQNYQNANGLDFRRLAKLADTSIGVTFDTVMRRALKGVTDESELTRCAVLPATPDWITVRDTCALLHIAPRTWAQMANSHPTAIYYGIRAKSRSTTKKLDKSGNGARGCGVLIFRPDIEKLNSIRKECGIGFSAAMKVFFALTEGRLK